MSFMTDKITLAEDEYRDLFEFLKKEPFKIEKFGDQYLVYSKEAVKWMFRRVTKKDKDLGKSRIEVWRYSCNGPNEIDKSLMVMQCYVNL